MSTVRQSTRIGSECNDLDLIGPDAVAVIRPDLPVGILSSPDSNHMSKNEMEIPDNLFFI